MGQKESRSDILRQFCLGELEPKITKYKDGDEHGFCTFRGHLQKKKFFSKEFLSRICE